MVRICQIFRKTALPSRIPAYAIGTSYLIQAVYLEVQKFASVSRHI